MLGALSMSAIVCNILILQFPVLGCCVAASARVCLENLMALIQVGIQLCCFVFMYVNITRRSFVNGRFVLYFVYFPDHLKYDYAPVASPEVRQPRVSAPPSPSFGEDDTDILDPTQAPTRQQEIPSPGVLPAPRQHIIEYSLSSLWTTSLKVLYLVIFVSLAIIIATIVLLVSEFPPESQSSIAYTEPRAPASVTFAGVLGV